MRKRRDENDHIYQICKESNELSDRPHLLHVISRRNSINVVAAELDSFAKSNRLTPYLLPKSYGCTVTIQVPCSILSIFLL
jgi:hypothetical protein